MFKRDMNGKIVSIERDGDEWEVKGEIDADYTDALRWAVGTLARQAERAELLERATYYARENGEFSEWERKNLHLQLNGVLYDLKEDLAQLSETVSEERDRIEAERKAAGPAEPEPPEHQLFAAVVEAMPKDGNPDRLAEWRSACERARLLIVASGAVQQ